jgi:hypothetical protein
MGTMVVDGRRLEFCAKVENRGAHKAVASESLIFLVYAQVLEKDSAAPAFEVVAPVTAGERGRLRAGKRGIFIDVAGKEWDAIVVEVVENPISIQEAAFAPFRRLQKMIGDRIQSMLEKAQASREKAMAVEAAGTIDAAAAPPREEKKADSGGTQNLLIGGSIAFAAVGSALAYVVSAVTAISPLKLLGGLAGIAAVVAGLAGVLGWLKLRRRDLGLLFEASGWAINPRMKITRRLGLIFTRTPDFPEGTTTDRRDMLAGLAEVQALNRADARAKRRAALILVVLVAAVSGFVYWRYFYRH